MRDPGSSPSEQMWEKVREDRIARCLVPAETYEDRVKRGHVREMYADHLAEALIEARATIVALSANEHSSGGPDA